MCKWCMSGSATENKILLSVLTRLNKKKSINQSIQIKNYFSMGSQIWGSQNVIPL